MPTLSPGIRTEKSPLRIDCSALRRFCKYPPSLCCPGVDRSGEVSIDRSPSIGFESGRHASVGFSLGFNRSQMRKKLPKMIRTGSIQEDRGHATMSLGSAKNSDSGAAQHTATQHHRYWHLADAQPVVARGLVLTGNAYIDVRAQSLFHPTRCSKIREPSRSFLHASPTAPVVEPVKW